ncbi:hypothetical protein D3C86_2195400 [compost metagenome]
MRVRYIRLRRLGIQIASFQQELALVIEAVEVVDKIIVERLLIEGGKSCHRYLSVDQLVDVELE